MESSVSVVIPYYNSSKFIGDAINSIRAQTLQPLEVIIVDDGSARDESVALDAIAGDCTIVRLPGNQGPSSARNAGIVRARGHWIAFLDSDDLWMPRKLELQLGALGANASCHAVHCGMQTMLPDGREFVTVKSDVELKDFLEFPCPIFPSAIVMSRDSLIACGLFDPTMGVCHDLDLFVRFCATYGRICAVPEPLVIRRVQSSGVSRNVGTFWSDAERVYRDFVVTYPDHAAARETLREVHTDMAVRAVYARDFSMLRERLWRATRRDVSLLSILWRVMWRIASNRSHASR